MYEETKQRFRPKAPTEPTRILIATTDGAVEIEAVIDLEPGAPSIVALGSSAEVISDILKAYRSFVALGSGVVARAVGHDAFRLELSGPIHAGDSWQLPVFLAHILHKERLLTEVGTSASRLVWATGRVDYQLRLQAIGHVTEKIEASFDRLMAERANGVTALVVLPTENQADLSDDDRARLKSIGAEIHFAKSMKEALDALSLRPNPVSPLALTSPSLSRMRLALAWFGASLVEACLIFAFRSVAPPWPPGIVVGAIAIASLALAAQLLLKRPRPSQIDNWRFWMVVVLGGLALVTYLGLVSLFEYAEPNTGDIFVKGFICTSDAAQVYKSQCPWLGLEQLSQAGYVAEVFWTASSIAIVRSGLAALWLAIFLLLSIVISDVASVLMGLAHPTERSSQSDR